MDQVCHGTGICSVYNTHPAEQKMELFVVVTFSLNELYFLPPCVCMGAIYQGPRYFVVFCCYYEVVMKILPFPSKGPASKFEELVHPHITYLYRLAFRFCGNQEDAEDLVQDLLIKLYPKRDELEKVEKLRPWMTTSLYRMFVDGYRKKSRSPLELIDDETAFYDTTVSDDSTPDKTLAEDQRINEIQIAFNRLSENHRVLLTLHDVEGYRLVEIESMLGTPVGTLKSRIHRARARMRELLANDLQK